MSQPVYGTIVNYRIGIRIQMPKWRLVQVMDESASSKADQLVGRKMILKFGKKNFVDRIIDLHAKKGIVKVKFHKGIPGQALGARVELLSQKASDVRAYLRELE